MNGGQQVDWSFYARELGARRPELLGRGMEGVVFRLGDATVAKVWFERKAAELRLIQSFYRELQAQSLSFAVPDITDVLEVADHVVTVERELEGITLRRAVERGEIAVDAAEECMVDVVVQLAGTAGGSASRALTVLGETTALWSGHTQWKDALAALVQRRLDSSGGILRAAVDEFTRKAERILALLTHLPETRDAIVHGDLFPANVLVDRSGRPCAVLDWGFLSTQADPAFEASVAAGIFDMYGPRARERDDRLADIFTKQPGYPLPRLLVYRAAYALITSTAYDPQGRDGHFVWCAKTLNREDITEALFSGDGAL